MNLVILHGRLSRESETKYSQTGTAFSNFSIAVKREFSKEGKQNVDFFNCVAFGKTADFIAKYFKKGDGIIVKGKVQIDTYEKDGEKRAATSILVDQVDFAEKSNVSSDAPSSTPSNFNVSDDEELPF